MDRVVSMFELQNSLNNSTNGESWVLGVTKNGKKIDWKRCIYMECAEVIDSFSWKHWKDINGGVDYENIKVEIVDIWHFVMSLAIELEHKNLTLTQLATKISSLEWCKKIAQISPSVATDDELLCKVESIMFDVLNKKEFDIMVLSSSFFELVTMGGLNLDELYKLYVGKNILNKFRQDHGYKDGTYKKIWGDKEDNVAMMQILDENPNLSPDELYAKLSSSYKN